MRYSAQVTLGFFKRIFLAQWVFVALTALFYLNTVGLYAAYAAFFGGFIALVNTWLLRWNFERAERFAGNDAGQNIWRLYRAVAQRLFSTIALFALALWGLQLEPQPLLLGFMAGLIALFVARYGFKK